MSKIRIDGRTYELRMNLWAMEKMEEEFGDVSEALKKFRQDRKVSTIRAMFVILANGGRIHEQEQPDVDGSALDRCSLGDLEKLGEKLRETLDEGMRVETVGGNEADDEHVDAFAAALEAREKKD